MRLFHRPSRADILLVSLPRGRPPGSPQPRIEECHDRQDEVPGLLHRARHAVQERLGGRKGVPRTGGLADRRGHQRPGSGRHHRRKPDADPQGARAGRRMVRGPGQGPGSGDRGRGLELDRRGGQPVQACREGRRRRGAGGHAVLQQADPGGALPALQGDQRRDRHSDHHVQHSRPLDRRHQRRHDEAALRVEEHRRREGRDRQHGAGLAAAHGDAARTSTSSPARTSPRSASTPTAVTAASR